MNSSEGLSLRLGTALALLAVALGLAPGCLPGSGAGQRNAFQTLTEVFGAATLGGGEEGAGGGAREAEEGQFRQTMNITFANNNRAAELNVSLLAWVDVSSIRSAEQQDALLRGGYVQLARQVRVGTAFTLPPGTFVLNGPGEAGSFPIRLRAASGDDQDVTATTREFNIITPDVILAFSQPPVSCDSVAFFYTVDGEIFNEAELGAGATGSGPLKTLAQIDAYQCDPFRPGLFLKIGGGARLGNEYLEGDNVRFDFFGGPIDAEGNFVQVTIGS